jgi:hypothetical protein
MENRTRIDRSSLLAAFALLAVALVPRILTAGRTMWFDERFTLLNTASIRDAMAYCAKDVHPPLYFVLVALWRMALPSTEFSLRMLSVIFGMASLVGIFLAARAVGGRWVGVAAFMIAALSPYHWIYSTELRPYPALLAFSAFSTWAFFGLLRTGKVRHFIVLAVSTVLNLYTHYFAVFLLAAQMIVFLGMAWRNSTSGAWTSAYRKRQILLGLGAVGLVAAAYTPWIRVFEQMVAKSVLEGQAVGVGRRIGRGVTLGLFKTSFYGSMGWGIVPFCIQAVLVAFAVLDKKLRDALLCFAAVWAVPFIILLVRRPSHFIDPKYFLFAYPATLVLVSGGLGTARRLLAARGLKSGFVSVALILAASASPLLPGQHPVYALHQKDWKDVIAGVDACLKPGDTLDLLGDTKTYAMILQYADRAFLETHSVVFSSGGAPGRSLESSASHGDVWILASGIRAERSMSGAGNQVKRIRTWDIYPASVSLYKVDQTSPASRPPTPPGPPSP